MITNQRGQASFIFSIVVAFMGGILVYSMLAPKKRHPKPMVAKVVLKKLKPSCSPNGCQGTYAYIDPSGQWWYLNFALSQNQAQSQRPYADYGDSVPKGGNWYRSDRKPEKEEIDEEEPVEVTESEDGEPENAQAAEDSASAGSETITETAPTDTASAAGSTAGDTAASSTTSSDAGSSGGDSGGGGGDGGGGGGGD